MKAAGRSPPQQPGSPSLCRPPSHTPPQPHPIAGTGRAAAPAAATGGRRYLGQPGDLDEPLEVEHVRGSAEEVPEAAGGREADHQEPGPGPQPQRCGESRGAPFLPSSTPPRPVPVKLFVEPVPVTLQGVRWETWGQQGWRGFLSAHRSETSKGSLPGPSLLLPLLETIGD